LHANKALLQHDSEFDHAKEVHSFSNHGVAKSIKEERTQQPSLLQWDTNLTVTVHIG
jgi:hypothetical protein